MPTILARIRARRRRRAARRGLTFFNLILSSLPPRRGRRAARGLLYAGLANLAPDGLAQISHALALIGLRRAGGPDLRRRLMDGLLVDARNDDLRRGGCLDLNARGGLLVNLVAPAERHHQFAFSHVGLEAHALDF